MKSYLLATIFASAFALSAVMALHADVSAQDAPKPAPKPAPEKPAPADPEKKPEDPKPAEKKPEPKADEKKADVKPAEKEYASEFTDYESLMKALRQQKLRGSRSVSNKNVDDLKGQSDRIRYFASKIVATDKDARAKNKDYIDWAAALEKQGRELNELVSAKTPDWEKIAAKKKEADLTCDNCHAKYDPED